MPLTQTLTQRYKALVGAGVLQRNATQATAVEKLQKLGDLLDARTAPKLPRSLASFFLKSHTPTPRGLYLYGPVGRGKTTMMDFFYEALHVERKRRAHFHAFMMEAHERLHRARQETGDGVADPVSRVAEAIASETRVLCFDEFAVTDIADATILARLFSVLLGAGVVVVATSNVEPARLYEGGRNRDLFLPFIALLQKRMDVIRLDAPLDYRRQGDDLGDVWFTPADTLARTAIDNLFVEFSGVTRGAPTAIELKQRAIVVPEAANGVARFTFDTLCGQALGPADYLALAREFDTLIVENVPVLSAEQRNEARRFIMLVDVLYEARALLIVSAAAPPFDLYKAAYGSEAAEFERAASRLIEMRGRDYVNACAARRIKASTYSP